MSQAGIVDFEGSGPSGPTTFVTNMGSAITIGGVIEILGSIVDAHGIPLQTTASGNTVTIQTQYASASASSSGTNAGLASFNSTYFTVDSNGYVTLNGSFIMETFQVDASTPPGTNPVYANSGGIITVTGGQVAAGVVGTNVIRTDSRDLYTYTIEIQRSTTAAVSTLADNGVSHFNSAQFTVDGNGFVSLLGTGAVETLTGNTGGAVGPTASNINVVGTGSTTASGNPGTSTLTIELTGLTNHAVLVGAGTATITNVGPTATAGQVLQSQGSTTDPAFSTATYPATTTINDILYSSSNNVVGQITASDNGVLISGTTGIPSWLANSATPGFVLTANSGAPASWQSITAEGAITTIDGDSGSMTPTAGVVTISGGTTGLTTTASASTMDLTGTLNVGHGGTGATTLTGVLIGSAISPVTGNPITQYDVLLGGASNAIVSLTNGPTGTVLVSNGASANPSWQTFAANVNIVRQVFTSTGTYTPTAGMVKVDIQVVGGGGGGGGAAATGLTEFALGGGAGGGGYAQGIFTAAAIGASQAVTIGAAGIAGAGATGATGGNGGTTSVGALISATGGLGAPSGENSSTVPGASGNKGGSGTGGDFQTTGSPGGNAMGAMVGNGIGITGFGGSSFFGGGGFGQVTGGADQSAGNAGTSFGGGGAGAYNTPSQTGIDGGVGFKGVVICTEYIGG